MKISLKRTSPNYRQPLSTQRIMSELTIAILALCAFAVVYNFTRGSDYGIHALLIIATSVITVLATEFVWAKVNGKADVKKAVMNSFPLVTALLFALTLPVGTPYYVVAIGAFIAIFFGKLIYGGFGQNIFNPALVGRVVVQLSFGAQLLTTLPSATDATTSASPLTAFASTNFLGELPVGLGTLFAGTYPGAIGETCTILILGLGVILAIRKVIDYRITVSMLVTAFVLGCIQGATGGLNPLTLGLAHIAMGGMALGAVFMATDPVTTPTSPLGKVIFGVCTGFIAMLLRVKANYPDGVLFAILLMNMFTPMIDNFTLGRINAKLPKQYATVVAIFVVACVTMFGVGSSLEPVVVEPETPVVDQEEEITLGIVASNGKTVTVVHEGFYPNKPMTVDVSFDGTTVTAVKVVSHSETKGFGADLIETGNGGSLTPAAQTFHDTIFGGSFDLSALDSIDTATGATVTATNLVDAIKEASSAAGSIIVTHDGFYPNKPMTVQLKINGTTVSDVKVISHSETKGFGADLIETGNGGSLTPAAQAFHDTIFGGSFDLSALDSIDTATGATVTTTNLIDAIKDAADSIGSITVTHDGFYPNKPMTIRLKIDGTTVNSVKVVSHSETKGFGADLIETGNGGSLTPAAQAFHDTIFGGSFDVSALDSIDTATGATVTATNLVDAIQQAVANN